MWIALRARARRALRRAARVRRARARCCSRTTPLLRSCSSARRATASPGTSCSPSSPRRRSHASRGTGAHAMRVVHVHRIRGIGGSERHLLTLLPALAERGIDADLRRARRSRLGRGRLLRRAPACRRCGSRRRATSTRCCSCGSRGRCAPTSCTRISCTPTSTAALAARLRGTRLVSTKHNDDPFRVGPFRYVERGLVAPRRPRRHDHRRAAPLHGRAGRRAGRQGRDDPLRPRRPARTPGASTRPTTFPTGARVLLAVARLTQQKGIDVAIRALAAASRRHGARRARRRARARRARAAGAGARRRGARLPARTRARRRRVARSRDRARAPGALGGLRPRRARGDARGPPRRRDERQLAPRARRRRRDRRARAARRRGGARARRSRARSSGRSSAPQAARAHAATSRSRGWRTARPRSTLGSTIRREHARRSPAFSTRVAGKRELREASGRPDVPSVLKVVDRATTWPPTGCRPIAASSALQRDRCVAAPSGRVLGCASSQKSAGSVERRREFAGARMRCRPRARARSARSREANPRETRKGRLELDRLDTVEDRDGAPTPSSAHVRAGLDRDTRRSMTASQRRAGARACDCPRWSAPRSPAFLQRPREPVQRRNAWRASSDLVAITPRARARPRTAARCARCRSSAGTATARAAARLRPSRARGRGRRRA